jgi:molecular chaperone DnaK
MKENWENHWKDYYQLLQVHPSAEPEVVKGAFDKLARKYHPDINKEISAPQRMKDINEAYEILSSPEKRNRYHQVYLQRAKKNDSGARYIRYDTEKTNEQNNTTAKRTSQTKRDSSVGIDFGFNNCVICTIQDGVPKVVIHSLGKTTLPSFVAISKTGECLVGEIAKRQAITNPDDTIYGIKRFLGRKWDEPARRQWPIEEEASIKSYKVTRAANSEVRVLMDGKEYSPIDIAALILQKLKSDAEVFLSKKLNDAVITVPVYFSEIQRKALKDAGATAGLNVLNLVDEPIAAALAYGIDKKKDKTIAVYNLGRDTFDVSILDVVGGIPRVKSTIGNTHLGGDAFDQRIVDWLCQEFNREHGLDPRQNRISLQRIKEAAEKAKIELSTVQETYVDLPLITADFSGGKNMKIMLSREKLGQLVADLVEMTIESCKKVLNAAGKTPDHVDVVILVGWQTRMTFVQQRVKQFFGREPINNINHDEIFAIGAAIRAVTF